MRRWYVGPRPTTRHAWDTALVRTHPRDRQPWSSAAPPRLCASTHAAFLLNCAARARADPTLCSPESYCALPASACTSPLIAVSSPCPPTFAYILSAAQPAQIQQLEPRADFALFARVADTNLFFFIKEVTMTFSESFYEYLKDNNAPQEILDRYEEYHPRPKTPTTLPEALADVKEQSTSTNSQPVGPCRHRVALTCAQEYRMEHVLHT